MMAAERDTIRFVLDGEVIAAKDVAPTTTVLEFLRTTLGRTGTKEGCAEGDCGACTVVLGELVDDRVRYRAINSCIRFLPTIDGHELVTTESLADGEQLHPVQQALVDHHGSQCGFCTPGFVMSLFALYLNERPPDRSPSAAMGRSPSAAMGRSPSAASAGAQERPSAGAQERPGAGAQERPPTRTDVLNTLAGNLCRCTGYRPIIAAGCAMNEYPAPQRWSRADAQSPARRARLSTLQRHASLRIDGFHAPQSIDELASTLAAHPDALILAGGTDVGLWSTKQLRELPPLVYIGEVRELARIERRDSGLCIGAAVSLTDAWQALTDVYPELTDLARRFASPPVCNSGTLCGNIANGSPIGDSMPILIALDAQLELRLGADTRVVPLDQFYLGYQRKDLRPGEFVTSVTIPHRRDGLALASYKVSKRFDQDIASVCLGIAVELRAATIHSARIAFGGMAAIPARAPLAERALTGAPLSAASFERATAALAADFKPLSDMRASSGYRLQIAGNLLQRFYHERSGSDLLDVHKVAAHG